MSDFVSNGWALYVAIATLVSIAACAALLYGLGRMRVVRKAGERVETTGHVWDEDLAELNHPLPRWWMWLFYGTIVFAFAYLVLYPGLGKLPGVLGWTSQNAYVGEVRSFDAKLAPRYARYLAMDLKEVARDPEARAMGERLAVGCELLDAVVLAVGHVEVTGRVQRQAARAVEFARAVATAAPLLERLATG